MGVPPATWGPGLLLAAAPQRHPGSFPAAFAPCRLCLSCCSQLQAFRNGKGGGKKNKTIGKPPLAAVSLPVKQPSELSCSRHTARSSASVLPSSNSGCVYYLWRQKANRDRAAAGRDGASEPPLPSGWELTGAVWMGRNPTSGAGEAWAEGGCPGCVIWHRGPRCTSCARGNCRQFRGAEPGTSGEGPLEL